MMKKQISWLLTAVMFYTRIPIPRSLEFSTDNLNRATRWFPLIGWIVGGLGAAVFYGLSFILPMQLAVFLSMAFTILLTGAFHEDGFADFCDGFGGGYTAEKILSIMKDSRIGTYGTIGLIAMLGTKFLTLQAMPAAMIPLMHFAGHAFSRLMPVLIIFTSKYSREDERSKTKPVGKKGSYSDLIIASVTALLPVALLPWQLTALAVPSALVLTVLFKRYTERKIGGYTGDCLGALQQMTEVLFYLCLLIIAGI